MALIIFLLLLFIFSSTERNGDLHTMNLQQKGLTLRIYGHLASILKKLEETTLLAAGNVFLNWNTFRGNTLTHVFMKTQETSGTSETPLSKTFENTHIFKESEKESESGLRLIVAGGALPIQGDLLLLQYHHHPLSELPETQKDAFTVNLQREVVV